MSGTETVMTVARACELLGVRPGASAGELRHAFRQAAKAAHPDRPDGCAERFRLVVEAHHILQRAEAEPQRPSTPPPREARRASSPPTPLTITPHLAANGGEIEHARTDGRRLRIALPAGLRNGDRFRAEEMDFEVLVRGDAVTVVRGDDLWITTPVDAKVLSRGGRVTIETPFGRRVAIITAKAAAQGLVRLQGQGLPPRGRHRQGHMFLRLEPAETRTMAQDILRRFTGGHAA